jgi:SAM-dependent methyltransferase
LAASYDDKANRTCKQAYIELVQRTLGSCGRVLEIGAGSSPLLRHMDAPFKVACDLSYAMLTAQDTNDNILRLSANAQQAPWSDGAFDGIFSINVLEHVPEPQEMVAEAARLLAPGGRFLAVTPNGDVEWLLDLLERLHLKLPEGPHKFLTFQELAELAAPTPFRVLEQRRFLTFPAGPLAFVKTIDALAPTSRGWGLFNYMLLEKTASPVIPS